MFSSRSNETDFFRPFWTVKLDHDDSQSSGSIDRFWIEISPFDDDCNDCRQSDVSACESSQAVTLLSSMSFSLVSVL